MSMDECEEAFLALCKNPSTGQENRWPSKDSLRANYDSEAFEKAIKDMIRSKMDEKALLKTSDDDCKTSVLQVCMQ